MAKKKYKTFRNLSFKKHPAGEGLQGVMNFPNGYGVSVVRFKIHHSWFASYTNNEEEWELAVFKDGHLCYTSGITDDVVGYLNARQVTQYMKRIQALPKD